MKVLYLEVMNILCFLCEDILDRISDVGFDIFASEYSQITVHFLRGLSELQHC